MRITAALLTLLASLSLPMAAIADDQSASFDARWPDTGMRKPSMTEMVQLVAAALKDDLKPAVKAELSARQKIPLRCAGAFCDFLNTR